MPKPASVVCDTPRQDCTFILAQSVLSLVVVILTQTEEIQHSHHKVIQQECVKTAPCRVMSNCIGETVELGPAFLCTRLHHCWSPPWCLSPLHMHFPIQISEKGFFFPHAEWKSECSLRVKVNNKQQWSLILIRSGTLVHSRRLKPLGHDSIQAT